MCVTIVLHSDRWGAAIGADTETTSRSHGVTVQTTDLYSTPVLLEEAGRVWPWSYLLLKRLRGKITKRNSS